MTNPLEYVHIALPEGGVFKISPSKFADFISYPWRWYRSEISKEEVFSHSTSSVIGTCVHYCAEQVAKNQEVDIKVIEEYIKSQKANDDYDPGVVLQHYVAMAERIVNDYVHPNKHKFLEVEKQHLHEIGDGYYVGGTLDVLEGIKDDCMIVDYKTYNKTTKPKSIPQGYKYQLLVYAYLLQKLGYNPTRMRLVYVNRYIDGGISDKTGKLLKSYPCETTVLTENIEEESMEYITSMIELCIDTIKTGKAHPELLHVIYHDPRIKQ